MQPKVGSLFYCDTEMYSLSSRAKNMFAVNGILKASRIDYFCCEACRLIEATYMTSLGCLCPKPASCMCVCMYITTFASI